jgi:hypothetical protein
MAVVRSLGKILQLSALSEEVAAVRQNDLRIVGKVAGPGLVIGPGKTRDMRYLFFAAIQVSTSH